MTSYRVGQLAALAGITIRTLHHYDRIGLLEPDERPGSGDYRRYGPGSVERLHRILSYRELGLTLDEIATLLDDPDNDRLVHLRRQERLLRDRIGRLEAMNAAVHLVMEVEQMSLSLHPRSASSCSATSTSRLTPRRRASAGGKPRRTRSRSAGRPATRSTSGGRSRPRSPRSRPPEDGTRGRRVGRRRVGMDLAERHRAHISRWFYDCATDLHRDLGEMYVADPRFAKHYDDVAEGLAEFVRDAIVANAKRLEATQ